MVIWLTPSPSSVHVVYGCPLMVMSDTRKLLDQEIDWALQRKEKAIRVSSIVSEIYSIYLLGYFLILNASRF